MTIDDLKSNIQDVPNFPKEGIIFKDITPLLSNPQSFSALIEHMCEPYLNKAPSKIVAIESRGFLLGSAMALKLNCGLVLARKKGKLPGPNYSQNFSLEYGVATLELKKDSLTPDDHVLIVDDVLATGGTAEAAALLCEKTKANVMAYSFLIELDFLNGKNKLNKPIHSLIKY